MASACVSTVDADLPEAQIGSEPAENVAAEQAPEAVESDSTSESASDDGEDGAGGVLPVGALGDPSALASAEESACAFNEPAPLATQPTCYTISVPENWADPDPEDQVLLQAAVFKAEQPSEDALIYFDGGPGGYTLDSLSFTYPGLIEPFLGDRDYVFFDQRGIGGSEPSLGCPELTEVAMEDIAGLLDPDTAQQANLDAQAACRDRLLGAGIDLTAYNSVASANDVEAMRQLLGYEQFNVISISYGTRLAQSYMRMYPQSARSVVLDSVFPTSADLWSNFNPGAIRSFEQLFDGCAASAICSAEFPDLKDRYFELLDQLDESPIELEASNLISGETSPMVVDGDDLMGLTFSALYDRSQFATLPQMVEDGLAGKYDIIEFFGSVLVTNMEFVSLGMRLSVECNEEIPFESVDVLLANEPTELPYSRLAGLENEQTLFDLCELWPAGVAPEVESLPISSDIPTLILAGLYDPITPPAGADEVAAGLSNYYSFLFPFDGHGLTPTDCGAELVNAFIADPATEPDSSCVAATTEPAWVPGNAGPVDLVEFELSGLIAVSGLRPDGWVDAGNGAFVRQQTAIDPTVLLVQPTGGLDSDALINLLSGQLETAFADGETIEIDGVDWNAYSSTQASDQAVRVAVRPGADGVLVLLVSTNEEIEALYAEIFEPIAAAATAG